MKISVTKTPKTSVDAIFFVVFSDQKAIEKHWNTSVSKSFTTLKKEGDFSAKKGEFWPFVSTEKKAKRMFFWGAGETDEMTVDTISARIVSFAVTRKYKNIAIVLPQKLNPLLAVRGSVLGNVDFKVTKKPDHQPIKQCHIITSKKISSSAVEKEKILAESMNFSRGLVNLPPNLMMPKILAKHAKEIAKLSKGKIKIKVLGNKEILKEKMGAMYAVGQGSAEESQLIVMEYRGADKKTAPTALVGKGVCFDSGGYNVKPTRHIEAMKMDMGGSAVVLGGMRYLALTKPKKNVVGIVGAVENLVSGNAYKPGDIITAMNGKTIEVTNTDAEGRLVLADCLFYAQKYFKPTKILDFATLTGGVLHALGTEITGIMGNNQSLVDTIKKSAENAGEKVWQLPLNNYFEKKCCSRVADLENYTDGVFAGSTMGGAFLSHFVDKKTPWVHFDIAGTAFSEKMGSSGSEGPCPTGATGIMIPTVREVVE